jgi:hypothetical protein
VSRSAPPGDPGRDGLIASWDVRRRVSFKTSRRYHRPRRTHDRSTARAYLKAAEEVGAIVVVYGTVKAALADLPALRGVIKLGPGQTDRQINIATFNPDWEGFAKGSSPLPDVQLEIITQHRRKFANVPLREPVQEPASVQEYHARGRLLGAGSERNTTPVDGRHTTPVDGRQKTTIVVGGSKEPLPKEAVPVELEKPTNGGCAEQSQQDRYQQLIRLCRGRVIVGRVLRLIRARIARGFAAAKPGSGGRIEYNPPPTPLIADAK